MGSGPMSIALARRQDTYRLILLPRHTRKIHRNLVDPCRALTDELHTKLHVVGIHGDPSADLVSSPITGNHGMVSHVIAKGSGAVLPVEANEQSRDTLLGRIDAHKRPV